LVLRFGRAGGVSDLPPPARKVKEFPMSKFVTRFLKDQSGATAIEYGLIAALVAVAIAAVLPTLGGKLTNTFGNVANKLP
jgi:pilus assembly protein Flp/PilA